MTKQEIIDKINKLENGIKSKATPSNLIAPLKAQKAKFEKELEELETAEKKAVKTKKVSKVAEKIKAAKKSVAKKTPAKAPAKEERKKDNIARDGDRKSLPSGKRISKSGNVYYETRANRSDKQTSKKPYLAKGGETDPMASVNEISRLTGLRPIAVAEWGDKNNINLSVVLKDLKSKKIKGMDLMTAVVGNPNNKYKKELLAKYSKSKMADGGETDGWKKTRTRKLKTREEAEKAIVKFSELMGRAGRNYKVEKMDDGYVISYESNYEPKMADGGKLPNGKYKYEKGDEGMFQGDEVRVVKYHNGDRTYEYNIIDEDGQVKTHGVAKAEKFENQFRYFPKMEVGGFLLGAAVGAVATNLLSKKAESKPSESKELTWKEKFRENVDGEGFDSAVTEYSEEIKDKRFNDLKTDYLVKSKALKKYIGSKEIIDQEYDISVKDAIDSEGFDYALEGFNDWKGVDDNKFQNLYEDYKNSRKSLSKYVGLGKNYAKGGDVYDDMNDEIEFANKKAKKIANSLESLGYKVIKVQEADYDTDAQIDLSEKVNVQVGLEGDLSIVIEKEEGKFTYINCGKSYATLLQKLPNVDKQYMEKGGKTKRAVKLTLSDKDSYDYTYKQDGATASITFGFGKEPFQYEVKKISKSLEPLQQDILDTFTLQGIKQHDYKGGFSEAIKHLDTSILENMDEFAKGGSTKGNWILRRNIGYGTKYKDLTNGDKIRMNLGNDEYYYGTINGQEILWEDGIKTNLTTSFGGSNANDKEVLRFAKGGELKKAQLLIIDPSNPLSTQVKKITGDFLNSSDYKDIGVGNFNILTHKHSNKIFIVYPKRIYDSLPEQEKQDDISYLKNVEKIRLDTRSMADGGSLDKDIADKIDQDLKLIDIKKEKYQKELNQLKSENSKDRDTITYLEYELENLEKLQDKLMKVKNSKMADGGETSGYSYGRLKGFESQDWEKMGREYAGSEWDNLSKNEKDGIISDLQKDWNKNTSFSHGGYVIFEGRDHYNDKPLYKVISKDEDNDYDGEFYDNREDAEKELNELKNKNMNYAKGGYMADGGKVDKELIDLSAKSIYDNKGMMSLRNTFLQVAKTDEDAGDKETAEYRRKVVAEYQSKQPKFMADGGKVPAHFGSGKNINVFGYQTENFDICATAVKEFESAIQIMDNGKETYKESLAKCAKYIDNLFGIEKYVVENGDAEDSNFYEAISDIMSASIYNYRAEMSINLFSFVPQHLKEIAARMEKAEKGGLYALGGMTAGRFYKDKSGEEFKFIGKVDSGANKGKFLFNDGQKSVYKDLEDFEGGTPKETKLFGFFEEGGMLIHGFQIGDTILEIYKGYGIVENNNNGVIEVLNPNRGTRFIIDLDESMPTGRKSMGMSKDEQMESAKRYIDYLDKPLPDTLLEKFRAEGKMADGGEVSDIDMAKVESSAKFYTDESRWSTKPTIGKFEAEIKELEEVKRKLDNKETTPSKIIGSGIKPSLARPLAYRWLKEQTLIAKRAIEMLKEKGKMADGGYMAKGGKTQDSFNWSKMNFNERLTLARESGLDNPSKVAITEIGLLKPNEIYAMKNSIRLRNEVNGGYMADGGLVVKSDEDLREVAKYMAKAVKKRWDLKDLVYYFEQENNYDYKYRVKIWDEMNVWEMKKTEENIYKVLKAIVEANEQGGVMAKGGKTQEKYEIELFFKGLSGDARKIGKYVVTQKTLEILESEWYDVLSIDVLDESDAKPITYNELREKLYSVASEKGFKYGGKMASGGKVKFADKVKSVQESLLKRKKVAPQVQKDYGKTYSKAEAKESAQRIVGSRMAQLKEKMAKKKK